MHTKKKTGVIKGKLNVVILSAVRQSDYEVYCILHTSKVQQQNSLTFEDY